jgi:hypothetical protein
MYTPFHFVCSRGHWIDQAVVDELTSRTYPETGIHYGFSCEPDDGTASCSFDYQWAYQVWDAEPHPRDETEWLVESIIPDGVSSPRESGHEPSQV